MKNEHTLLKLFFSFLKIGALTFGGGYAMMPIMRKEVVDIKKWVSDDDILKILVISESTPGVLAINSATFIGYKISGVKGSIVATLGVVIPSFVIISIISLFILQFKEAKLITYAFYGIQAGVALLIFRAALKLSKKVHYNVFAVMILIGAILFSILTAFSVIYVIIVSAIIGIIYGSITHYKEAKK